MSVEHVKSTPVTNLDATPVVPNTAGQGAQGYVLEVTGTLTVPASASQDSTLRFARVPTDAVVKSLVFTSAAQAGGTIDLGLYYPVIGITGKADLAANAIDQDFFASALAVTSDVQPTDVTFEALAGYIRSEWNTPLWQAAGLTSDPGGYFDIVGTVVGAITTGLGTAGVSVRFTQ